MISQQTGPYRLGKEEVATQDEFLRLACRLMAGRCDGARTHDGIGFSRFDQAFGHKMAEIPWRDWSPRQKWAVYELLAKYRNTQLRDIWYLIKAPEKPTAVTRLEKQREHAKRSGLSSGRISFVRVDDKPWIAIDVPYNSSLLQEIAQIPGRRWHKGVRLNLIPYNFGSIDPVFEFAAANNIPIDRPLLEKLEQTVSTVETRVALSHASDTDFEIPDLPDGLKPYPFQRAGIQYIVEHAGGRGLIADEMGLGKTIQGLLAARLLGAKRTVVISPNSAKLNWQVEARRWWPGMDSLVLFGGPPKGARDIVTRLEEYDKHLRPFPDVFERIVHGDRRGMTEAMQRYQVAGRTQAIMRSLWDSPAPSEVVPDGPVWSPELSELAIERMQIAKGLTTARAGMLFLPDWLCILNWDILHAWGPIFEAIGIDLLIADEFHMAKNPSARRSKACESLAKHTKHIIGLTGTPVMNDPAEFGQLITLLGYIDVFGGRKGFWQEYVLGITSAMNKTERLHSLNQRARARFMVRRIKKDVLPDMPPLQHAMVPMQMTPAAQARYEEVESDIAAYFAERAAQRQEELEHDRRMGIAAGYSGEALAVFVSDRAAERYDAAYERAEAAKALLWWEGLKQICVEGKMPQVFEWIDDFLENGDQKLVIFASHTSAVEKIAQRYNAPMIYGNTPVRDRQAYVEDFQANPETRVIVGNLQAMGTALTLTAASNVAFVEFGWNPAAHDQASGRCHRIGQKDSVTAWYLTAVRDGGVPTVDVDIIDLIAKKREIVDATTDGAGAAEDMSILRELSERVRKRTHRHAGRKEGPVYLQTESASYAHA